MRSSLAPVVLFTGLLVASPSPAQEAPAALKEEVHFLPDGSQLVGLVQMKALASPAYAQLKSKTVVANFEMALLRELPLKVDMIDRVVLGGIATSTDEGIFVFRTKNAITKMDVLWSKDTVDPPREVKVGKYELQQRRTNSYCLVGYNLLLVGESAVLKKVLMRDKEPTFSAPMQAALKELDANSTVALAMDVKDVRAKRRGKAHPFIPGLSLDLVESKTESLTVCLTFGDDVQLAFTTTSPDAKQAGELKDQIDRFSTYATTAVKKDLKPAAQVVELLSFAPVVKEAQLRIEKKLPAAPLADLIELLSK